MADVVMAKESFVGKVGAIEMDVRKGDLIEADHPAVTKWPGMFGPVNLRFPVERRGKVEQATSAPGEKRAR